MRFMHKCKATVSKPPSFATSQKNWNQLEKKSTNKRMPTNSNGKVLCYFALCCQRTWNTIPTSYTVGTHSRGNGSVCLWCNIQIYVYNWMYKLYIVFVSFVHFTRFIADEIQTKLHFEINGFHHTHYKHEIWVIQSTGLHWLQIQASKMNAKTINKRKTKRWSQQSVLLFYITHFDHFAPSMQHAVSKIIF